MITAGLKQSPDTASAPWVPAKTKRPLAKPKKWLILFSLATAKFKTASNQDLSITHEFRGDPSTRRNAVTVQLMPMQGWNSVLQSNITQTNIGDKTAGPNAAATLCWLSFPRRPPVDTKAAPT